MARPRRDDQQRGIVRWVAQLVRGVRRAPPSAPAAEQTRDLVAPAWSGMEPARDRARRALADARQAMSGVLGDDARPLTADDESRADRDLERLRLSLESAEQDRAALREAVSALTTTISEWRGHLAPSARATARADEPRVPDYIPARFPIRAGMDSDDFTDATPASSDSAPPQADGLTATREREVPMAAPGISVAALAPDALVVPTVPPNQRAIAPPASESSAIDLPASEALAIEPPATDPPATEFGPTAEHGAVEQAAAADNPLLRRVFAAGTIGTRIELRPVPPFDEFTAFATRLATDGRVEHVESLAYRADMATLRLILRSPLRWDALRPLVEAALGGPLGDEQATWQGGALVIQRRA